MKRALSIALASALAAGGAVAVAAPAQAMSAPVVRAGVNDDSDGWISSGLTTAAIKTYRVLLVQSAVAEAWRPFVQTTASFLNSLGYSVTVVPGVVATAPADLSIPRGEIYVKTDVPDGEISSEDVLGNASSQVDNNMTGAQTAIGGRVSISAKRSAYVTGGDAAQKNMAQSVLSHEFGHVLGLAHITTKYQNQYQAMYPAQQTTFTADQIAHAMYLPGDINGLRDHLMRPSGYGSIDVTTPGPDGNVTVEGWGEHTDASPTDKVRLVIDGGARTIDVARTIGRPDVVAALYPSIRQSIDKYTAGPSVNAGFKTAITGLSDGQHSLTLQVADPLGNWQSVSTKAVTTATGLSIALVGGGGSLTSVSEAQQIMVNTGAAVTVKPGTMPAMVRLGNGNYAIAYHGIDDNLYTWTGIPGWVGAIAKAGPAAGVALGANASPAITANPKPGVNGVSVVYLAVNGSLSSWTGNAGATGGATSQHASSSVAPDATPDVTTLRDGGLAVAYRGANGHLWVYTNSAGDNLDTGAVIYGDPTITALPDGTAAVAFLQPPAESAVRPGPGAPLAVWTGAASSKGTFTVTDARSWDTRPAIATLPSGKLAIAYSSMLYTLATWTGGAGEKGTFAGLPLVMRGDPTALVDAGGHFYAGYIDAATGTLNAWEGTPGQDVGQSWDYQFSAGGISRPSFG